MNAIHLLNRLITKKNALLRALYDLLELLIKRLQLVPTVYGNPTSGYPKFHWQKLPQMRRQLMRLRIYLMLICFSCLDKATRDLESNSWRSRQIHYLNKGAAPDAIV